MKPEHFIYKSDGLYYMQNVPEEPNKNSSSYHPNDEWFYLEAIERAKEEAVLVTEPYIYQKAMHSYFPHHIDYSKTPQDNFAMYATQGQIYTINMEEKIEVVDIPCGGAACPSKWGQPCIHSKFVARIIPKKAEESEDEFIAYIEALKNQSFEGWNENAVSGYMTALASLFQKYVEIKRKPL